MVHTKNRNRMDVKSSTIRNEITYDPSGIAENTSGCMLDVGIHCSHAKHDNMHALVIYDVNHLGINRLHENKIINDEPNE